MRGRVWSSNFPSRDTWSATSDVTADSLDQVNRRAQSTTKTPVTSTCRLRLTLHTATSGKTTRPLFLPDVGQRQPPAPLSRSAKFFLHTKSTRRFTCARCSRSVSLGHREGFEISLASIESIRL